MKAGVSSFHIPQNISLPLSRRSETPTQLNRARCRGTEGDEWDGVSMVQTLCLSSCWMKVTCCCEINRSWMVRRWWQLLIHVN